MADIQGGHREFTASARQKWTAMTTASSYWKRTNALQNLFIRSALVSRSIPAGCSHCRRVEVERANDAHRLSLGGRLAIALSLLPRAARGIRIFQDMIA